MPTECLILRRYKCKRNLIMMAGLTLSVSGFVYMFGTLMFTSLTPGVSLAHVQNVRSLQESMNVDENLDEIILSKGYGSKSGSADSVESVRSANDWVLEHSPSHVYLDDDEDIIQHKEKARMNKAQNVTKHKTKRLPQAIIIGVKKAGTRALLEYLRLHPDVKAPGPETHFFDKNYNRGLDWYRNAMPDTRKGEMTIEKTPSYFVTKGIPKKVYEMSKKTKLIIVFRDPVTRAISDYAQLVSRNPKAKTFEELVYVNNRTRIIDTSWTIVKIGVYAQHLARWREYFPLSQMHFVSGENLIKSPANEMKRIQEFLGLEQHITADNFTYNHTKGFPCYRKDVETSKWHCLNEEKGRQHPDIKSSVRRHLEDFYRPFNLKLYSMIGQDFGWS